MQPNETLIAGYTFSPKFAGHLKNKNDLTTADVSHMSNSNANLQYFFCIRKIIKFPDQNKWIVGTL